MAEHELEKLLGGFAADTLTQEEKQRLYSAALQDQKLFNMLADEQALKELLADPNVRRRLIQTLKQTSASGAGGSRSWLDWFRRPAGLAFAGGLAAAALAVVLGIRIYQDSLKQAVQSVATEESKPNAPPAIVAPQEKAKRERPAPPEQQDSNLPRISSQPRPQQDEAQTQTESPVAAVDKTAVTDQKPAASTSPSAAQAPARAPLSATVTPAFSARALFYGGAPGQADAQAMAKEQEQAMRPLAESAPQANRLERKLDQSAQAGKVAGTATQLKLLGLRYSLVVRGTDGQEQEVDVATASKSTKPASLTVETNQDAYLQVWKRVGAATPQLLLPQKESGQISLKIAAGQQQSIPLPTEREPVTLTARLSRVPFGPITRQEAAMFDRLSPHQLQESIAASGTTASQEQATYVVNQDPSPTAQISVEIPLSR